MTNPLAQFIQTQQLRRAGNLFSVQRNMTNFGDLMRMAAEDVAGGNNTVQRVGAAFALGSAFEEHTNAFRAHLDRMTNNINDPQEREARQREITSQMTDAMVNGQPVNLPWTETQRTRLRQAISDYSAQRGLTYSPSDIDSMVRSLEIHIVGSAVRTPSIGPAIGPGQQASLDAIQVPPPVVAGPSSTSDEREV